MTIPWKFKIDRACNYLGLPLRGRPGWNEKPTTNGCCLNLRNDNIGLAMANMVSQINIFDATEQKHRSLPWLPGLTLHLSVKRSLRIRKEPELLHRESSSDTGATASTI